MAKMKLKATDTIQGPNGQMFQVGHLKEDIVKREMVVRRAIAEAKKLSGFVEATQQRIAGIVENYLNDSAADHDTDWQGSTILRSFDGTMQVEVDIKQIKSYSEQLNVAGEIIREWIEEKLSLVKDPALRKTFAQIADIAKAALRIDAKGKVDQQRLLQLKKFDFPNEPRWQEAMELINEAEQITGSKRYIRFKEADEAGKMNGIRVNFFEF